MRRPSHLLFAVLALVGSPLAATPPLGIHIHSDKAMFQVLISPGTVGADNFVPQLMSGEGTLLAMKEATLVLSPPGQGTASHWSERRAWGRTAIGTSMTCNYRRPAAGTCGSML